MAQFSFANIACNLLIMLDDMPERMAVGVDDSKKSVMEPEVMETNENASNTINPRNTGIQAEVLRTEKYESGVYVNLVQLPDGTTALKSVRFSRRLFEEHQAENWWSEHREKVIAKYNVKKNCREQISKDTNVKEYEKGVYVTLVQFPDGTTDLKRVQFSRRLFKECRGVLWWSENREKVIAKYNIKSILGSPSSQS
ncbi:protein Brevis radix-like 1 [Tasmannia lanceolata]|uniref:protein Brevis radix-like 1 n=1 Tax=Tasmannia lanceolata TaxID=3420 RepID=UPI004062FCEB